MEQTKPTQLKHHEEKDEENNEEDENSQNKIHEKEHSQSNDHVLKPNNGKNTE